MKINKILISQPKPATDKSPYFDIARQHGVEIVFRPFIKVEGLTAKEFRQQKLSLPDFTAIIFTSRGAVDHFFRIAEETRFSVPDTMRYFCTSEAIALYLQKYITYRKRKIFFGETGRFADIIPLIQKHNKEKYLYVSSDTPNPADLEMLNKTRCTYATAVMFRTVSNDFGPDEAFDYDMLIFFSPQGIQALKKNFPDFKQGDTCIATFGNETSKAVSEAGMRVDLMAPTPKMPSMAAALDDFLKNHRQDAPAK